MADTYPYAVTAHAANVIAERAISLAWEARVLTHPEKIEPDRAAPMLRRALASIPEYGGKSATSDL